MLDKETYQNGDMVHVRRKPASINVNFVYALKADNSKFVEFIVKAALK